MCSIRVSSAMVVLDNRTSSRAVREPSSCSRVEFVGDLLLDPEEGHTDAARLLEVDQPGERRQLNSELGSTPAGRAT